MPSTNFLQEEKHHFRRENHLQTSETTRNSSAGQAGETAIKQIYAYL
jgi:hypothetical protein